MPKLNWNGNDFRNNRDSSGTVADTISRNGNLQQGYDHGSLTRGLVAYYPMEKGEGEVLHDGALNNIGQIKGANWNNGNIGEYSLDFDGATDYVDLDTSLNLSDTWTISFWAYPRSGNSEQHFVIGKSTEGLYLKGYQTDKVGFRDAENYTRTDWDGSGNSNNVSFSDISDNWHHFIFKSDGASLYLWIDGSYEGYITPDSVTLNPHELGINRNDHPFGGDLSEVRVYERALSQPEIETLSNISSPSGVENTETDVPGQEEGGVSRYELNGNADDSWGTNHGTNNGVDLATTGIYDEAGEFVESENDSIELGEVITDDQNSVTISAWAKLDSINNNPRIFGGAGANEEGVSLFVESNGTPRFYVHTKNTDADLNSPTTIPNNEWIHYVATYNSDTGAARLFINGSIDTQVTGSGNIANTELEQQIGTRGGRDTLDDTWDGKIDDVRIYDKALTPLQVEKLYHKGAYRISRESTLQ